MSRATKTGFSWEAAVSGMTKDGRRRVEFVKPGWYGHVSRLVGAGFPVLLVGPCGCGKTMAVSEMAREAGVALYRVNFDGGMTPDAFIGGLRIRQTGGASETYFQAGPVLEAVTAGGWLMLDEIDKAAPEYSTALHALVEGAPLVVNDDGGRKVVPAEGFRILATANILDMSDEAGYWGCGSMNVAFRDRFSIIRTGYDREVDVLEAVCGSRQLAESLHKAAVMVRGNDDLALAAQALSTRRLVAFLHVLGLARASTGDNAFAWALESEVLGRLRGMDRRVVSEVFRDAFGKDAVPDSPWAGDA